MADQRKPYQVTINGVAHTLLLGPEEAKRLGDRAKPAKGASKAESAPANKAREAPANKAMRASSDK